MRERGIGLVITVMLILVVAVAAVLVATSFSGSSIRDTGALTDSNEALLLAETAVERAIKRFTTGTVCASLTDGSAIELVSGSGKTFQVTKAVGTDFAGATLIGVQCRIEAEGRISASNVSRRIQVIIDQNLLGSGANATFDDPPGTGLPNGWAGGAYDYTGGPAPTGAAPTACNRSAYAVKTRTGGSTAGAAGNLGTDFTVTGGSTVTVLFDYRMIEIGNSGSVLCSSAGGSTCTGAADPTSPSGAAGVGEICFTITDSTALTSTSTKYTIDPATSIAQTVTSPACLPTTQSSPASYPSCPSFYNVGAPVAFGKGRVTILVGGAGTRTINTFSFNLFIKAGQPNELRIDNIEFSSPSGSGMARARYWRDCTVASCP